MKKQTISPVFEGELLERFLITRPNSRKTLTCSLTLASRKYQEVFGESFLNHTNTNDWIPAWLKGYSCSFETKAIYLGAIHQFWQWLFSQRIIPDNILRFTQFTTLVSGNEPLLVLPPGLHRCFHEYLPLHVFNSESVKQHRNTLFSYIRFIAQQPESGQFSMAEAFSIKLLSEFLQQNAGRSFDAIYSVCCHLNDFTEHLIELKKLESNPVRLLLSHHGCSQYKFITVLQSKDSKSELAKLSPRQWFQSCMADDMNAFIEWKRTTGCKFQAGRSALHAFDSFLFKRPQNAIPITECLLNDFAETQKNMAPITRAQRLNVARNFCKYLQRTSPGKVAITVMGVTHSAKSQRLPYIIMPELFEKLIAQVRIECQVCRNPLTVEGIIIVLELMYASGLRIGEVFRLRIQDVNLDENTLFVRQTKFNKDRIVPFSDSVKNMLIQFSHIRQKASRDRYRNDELFFPSSLHFSINAAFVSQKFRAAAKTVCGLGPTGRGYPRIHDLRHSFAVRILLLWYQEGSDVQNRLPILSTYLGHIDFISTQKYITMTSELRHAASMRFNDYSGNIITVNQ